MNQAEDKDIKAEDKSADLEDNAADPLELIMPGWAIRVYACVNGMEGTDALQAAILGLIKAGSPGLAGSLANELCLEETIVESALKSLREERLLQWGDGEWEIATIPDQEDEPAKYRPGWVFWDSLRQRLIPELLFDDIGPQIDRIDSSNSGGDSFGADDFPAPSPSQVTAELIPTVQAKGFKARQLDGTANDIILADFDETIQRVAIQGSRRAMRWHPLIVPYRIQTNLGARPAIYCCEPTFSPKLTSDSSYSPYLRAVLEENVLKAYAPIIDYAEEEQRKLRLKHSAKIFADIGSPERLDEEAANTVRQMMGEARLGGAFATDVIIDAAEDAERSWIFAAKLSQSSKSLRIQYSSVLQAIATCLSDELLPLWKNSSSARDAAFKFPSYQDAKRRRANYDTIKNHWNAHVQGFSETEGISFDSWSIGTAGEMKKAAVTYTRRTQLGIVLRSWGAFAICASDEPEGQFVLNWIRESLIDFPDLFEVFEKVKNQRNVDKGRSLESIPIGDYRTSIYSIWKAISNGHTRAIDKTGKTS